MQIIILLVVISLPVVILIDSKKRLGRFRWGWALISGFMLMTVLGQIGSEVQAIGRSGSRVMAHLLGGFIGGWLGLFALYRGFTRKKTSDKTEQSQQQ
jgi:putative Mn2+ efflux pump MntP